MPPTRLELQRMKQLEEQLELLYEKRHTFEAGLTISASSNEQFELRQRLRRDVLPSLRRTEQEYAQLLAGAVEPTQLPETEAQTLLQDVRGALASYKHAQPDVKSEEFRRLLVEIRSKLDEPGKAAAAKLKIVLPLIPLVASYELELDTESFVSQVWQRMRGLFRRAVPNPPS